MKKLFITLAMDRMQNLDLLSLYGFLYSITNKYDAKALQLNTAFERLQQQKNIAEGMTPKERKIIQNDELVNLRTKIDNLVCALIWNLKALKKAEFEHQTDDLRKVYPIITKVFKNYTHEPVHNKELRVNAFQNELNKKDVVYDICLRLGLMQYIDSIEDKKQQIITKNAELKKIKEARPTGLAQKSKEKTISEMRFFLQLIESAVITHPDIDYEILVAAINKYLTKCRTQLRNTSTRRAVAKAKTEKKKASEDAEKKPNVE